MNASVLTADFQLLADEVSLVFSGHKFRGEAEAANPDTEAAVESKVSQNFTRGIN